MADKVSFLFDHGLREEDHKSICEDKVVTRPSNCPAFAAVECNPQIMDALMGEPKKTNYRMKEVNKDILRTVTIITKSLLLVVVNKVAQEENHPVVTQEVGMINSALALLGNVNFRNKLGRRYIMKREINHKFMHHCTEKVSMTQFLFGDGISQSMKQIKDSMKLKNAITPKKLLSKWCFPGGRSRGVGTSAYVLHGVLLKVPALWSLEAGFQERPMILLCTPQH